MMEAPPQTRTSVGRLRTTAILIATAALAFAGLLLVSDVPLFPDRWHAYLSSLPLAAAGLAYAILQIRLNPPREMLLKRLMLAATFVLWAVDQLLPPGRLATVIGDFVIAAYVLDLYWLMQEQSFARGEKS